MRYKMAIKSEKEVEKASIRLKIFEFGYSFGFRKMHRWTHAIDPNIDGQNHVGCITRISLPVECLAMLYKSPLKQFRLRTIDFF